jgi:hypothetical protein
MRIDIITKEFNPESKYLTKREELLKAEADNYIPSILFKQKVNIKPKETLIQLKRRGTTKGVNRRFSLKNMSRKNSTVAGIELLIRLDRNDRSSSNKRKASFSNPPSGRNIYQVSSVDKGGSNINVVASAGFNRESVSQEKRSSMMDDGESVNISPPIMNRAQQEAKSKLPKLIL